jgi:hypothetical protein
MRYNFIAIRISNWKSWTMPSVGEDEEQQNFQPSAGGKTNCYSHTRRVEHGHYLIIYHLSVFLKLYIINLMSLFRHFFPNLCLPKIKYWGIRPCQVSVVFQRATNHCNTYGFLLSAIVWILSVPQKPMCSRLVSMVVLLEGGGEFRR